MTKDKICAVTVDYPGVRQWFEHGHRAGLWNLHILKEGEQELPDADIYLLGAFHRLYIELVEKLRASTNAKICVAWSSTPTEMDDPRATAEVLYWLSFLNPSPDTPKIDAYCVLDPSLVHHFPNAVHLPAPISPEELLWDCNRRGIAFYAPATAKKNILTQLLAIRQFQREDPEDESRILRTNLDRYRPMLHSSGIKYECEAWLPERATLLQRLASSRVAMAASHAEAWCYGAVDALSVDTPVVGSPTIGWLPPAWQCTRPNDAQDVHDALVAAWNTGIGAKGWLSKVAERQNEACRAALDTLKSKFQ